MSELVFKPIIANATPLPPGGSAQSQVIDVKGARTVNLMFGITNNDPNVHWVVHFGPTTNNAFAPTSKGDFGAMNNVAISLPVFGTGLFLVVSNQGNTNHTTDGTIYFIREL
jgi:hypothetical protein